MKRIRFGGHRIFVFRETAPEEVEKALTHGGHAHVRLEDGENNVWAEAKDSAYFLSMNLPDRIPFAATTTRKEAEAAVDTLNFMIPSWKVTAEERKRPE